MMIYDKNSGTINTDYIQYIVRTEYEKGYNKLFSIYFCLRGESVKWTYDTLEEREDAFDKLNKLIDAKSINELKL